MTAVHPDKGPASDSAPLAPIRWADVDGLSYNELADERDEPRARMSLTEMCLMCGGTGHWSSHYANAVYVPPRGHRMEYITGPEPIVMDSCGNHLVT